MDIFYYYNKKDVLQEKLDMYIKLAEENGIEYCGYDPKFSVHEFSQETQDDRCIGIFMPEDKDECFI